MMDVSIIIVNYNTRQLTCNCLVSVFEHTKDINFEVIVADNGSTDGSVEMIRTEFPQVILIENNANLGFGAANNRGLAVAKGKYIFYLNSDTLLLNNAVKIFFDYWECTKDKENLGALGCNLINSSGEIIHSYGRFPSFFSCSKMLIRRFFVVLLKKFILFFFPQMHLHRTSLKYQFYEGNVDYVTGADLFLKNNNFSKFDERFFLYAEETDLQFKIMKKKLIRRIIAGPKIIHFEGGSDNKCNQNLANYYYSFSKIQMDISICLFIKLHTGKFAAAIIKFFVLINWSLFWKKTKTYCFNLLNI